MRKYFQIDCLRTIQQYLGIVLIDAFNIRGQGHKQQGQGHKQQRRKSYDLLGKKYHSTASNNTNTHTNRVMTLKIHFYKCIHFSTIK